MIKEFLDKTGLQQYHEYLKNALKIKADQSAVDTLSETVNSKADQSTVDDLTAIVNNKADATALDNKADKTTVNDLASVINNKADQTVVDDLADEIDSKADQTDVDAKADQSAVDTLSETVNSKADQSTVDDLKNILYGGSDDQFLVGFTDEAPKWCDCSEIQATLEIDKKADKTTVENLENIIMSGGEEIGDDAFMISCAGDTPSWISTNDAASLLAYDLNRIHGLDDLKERVTNLENSGGGSSSSYSSTYKLLGRHSFTNATSGYVNMSSYYNQYDDVMIIVRVVSTSSTGIYVSNNTTANSTGIMSAGSITSSGGSYRKITYNKTDDGYRCWECGSTMAWSSSSWNYIKYYSSASGATSVSIVVYGR